MYLRGRSAPLEPGAWRQARHCATAERVELERDFHWPWPLDLFRTVGTGNGPRDPTKRVERQARRLWRTFRWPEGAATLCFRHADVGEGCAVRVNAWGPAADYALSMAPALLGADDDPAAFVPRHRLVRDSFKRHRGLRLGRGHGVFDTLMPTILGQRVTSGEAYDSYRKMVFELSERAPGPVDGPKLWLPPSARAVGALPVHALHRFGVEASRAETLMRAAHVAPRLEESRALSGREAYDVLQKVRGVGPWTAAITTAATHGWADAVPLFDYHIPKNVVFALTGEERGDDRRMLQVLAPYKGQRYRAISLILASGVGAPRRGPRMAAWAFAVERERQPR